MSTTCAESSHPLLSAYRTGKISLPTALSIMHAQTAQLRASMNAPQSPGTQQSTRLPSGVVQQTPARTSTPGLRYPSGKRTIYDRNINRSKTNELSRAAFAYLFVEMISYAQRRVKGIADLEKRLNTQAYPLGVKLLDLLVARQASTASTSVQQTLRLTRIIGLLQFITTTLWRHLFGRAADALERSASNPAEYMVSDNEPLVNSYISVPREMSQLNCAAFVAGIIEGVCDGAGFETESVTAHWQNEGQGDQMWPGKTIFLIRFKSEVLEREELLGKGS